MAQTDLEQEVLQEIYDAIEELGTDAVFELPTLDVYDHVSDASIESGPKRHNRKVSPPFPWVQYFGQASDQLGTSGVLVAGLNLPFVPEKNMTLTIMKIPWTCMQVEPYVLQNVQVAFGLRLWNDRGLVGANDQ